MGARRLLAGVVLTCGIMLAGVGISSPALAADGTAESTDAGVAGARTQYKDDGDIYTVCDRDADSMGAVGWIEIKQEDGSWNKFREVYVGGGAGACEGNNVDVNREGARVKIVACRQNGSTGNPQDCGRVEVPGA
ncbi:hypothetical protein O7606_13815 [Micromonospora sp. WMMD882]|uniref:hypothetical protein n=1 Tax=Micromonospora sp. WMMD882 TaxID=3015151 RepID=UPI00248C7AFE|nr:hypothetical protein [Micromonospora sp. WMMD882]WBB77373.1 hypothetical protein O7606_13815 [Micromonospora sp. WMMD882]